MKIAVVLKNFACSRWGATESMAWHTALESVRNGHSCEILATSALDAAPESLLRGIRIRRFPHSYGQWPLGPRTRRRLDRFDGEPRAPALQTALRDGHYDLIHSFALGTLAEAALEVAEAQQIPLIVNCRSAQMKSAAVPETPQNDPPLRQWVARNRKVLERAAAVIAADRRIHAALASLLPHAQIHWIPPGIDLAFFRRLPPLNVRALYSVPAGRKLLLVPAKIRPESNQLAMLELLAALTAGNCNCQLVFCGPEDDPEYARKIRKRAAALRLAERVTWISGPGPEDDRIPALLQTASILLIPALFDAAGLRVLAAWAAGTPVIASPVGAAGSLIEDGRTGFLVDPADAGGWLNRCRSLLNDRDPELRLRLRTEVLQAVAAYDWKKIGMRLDALYHHAVQRSAGRKAE